MDQKTCSSPSDTAWARKITWVRKTRSSVLATAAAFITATTTATAATPADGQVIGIAFVGRMVEDLDKSIPFYQTLGLTLDPAVDSAWRHDKALKTDSPWMQGDFTDSVVGGHGNILRFFNESFPEAADPGAGMHFELVEFQNRKKAVRPYHIYDISVGYVGMEVRGIDTLLARAKGAGARVISDGGGIVKLENASRATLVRDPDAGGFVEMIEPKGRGQ